MCAAMAANITQLMSTIAENEALPWCEKHVASLCRQQRNWKRSIEPKDSANGVSSSGRKTLANQTPINRRTVQGPGPGSASEEVEQEKV